MSTLHQVGHDADLIPKYVYSLCYRCRKWIRCDLDEGASKLSRVYEDERLRFSGSHTCRGEKFSTSISWRLGETTNIPLRPPGEFFCTRCSNYVHADELGATTEHACCGRSFHRCIRCMGRPLESYSAVPGDTWETWFFRAMHTPILGYPRSPQGCATRCLMCTNIIGGRYDMRWSCAPASSGSCSQFCRSCYDIHRQTCTGGGHHRSCQYTCPSCHGNSFDQDGVRTACTWCGATWLTRYAPGQDDQTFTAPTAACRWCGPHPCTCATQLEATP